MRAKKMDEATLVAQIEAYERQATGSDSSEVAQEQAEAMDYYLRRPFGTEEEGRSQVVSSDVWDVVEGLTPIVLKPFVSTDDIVRFNPHGAEDEEAAEQESDYLNYVVTQKNDVFSNLVAWVKTGLLQKNGVVKYWWEKSRRTEIERYEGLSDDLYAILLQDKDVTVVEHTETQTEPMMMEDGQMMEPELLHDVVLRVAKEHGEAKYCVIPPEEFLIDRNATSPNPKLARFVEHRTRKTISEVREMGYEIEDDISDDGVADTQYSQQFQARRQNNEGGSDLQSVDPAGREVMFREIYLQVDYDGDGITELRKVCMVGRKVLANEETEEIPFCAWTPYQQSFKFYGRCPADETIEIQLTKSTLWRQSLDNIYTINNNRVFASDKVNLDDLLDNQIAGVVRVNGDVVGNHVMTVPIQPIGGVIQPMLEYLDSAKENRTGFTRYNQGTDSNSLNKTATGIRIIAEAGNERINLISRSFAELGLKPLMLGMHGLCRRHATKAEVVKLRGKWVTVNPRDWKTRYDMTVSVGLGNADMTMKMQGAQMVLQEQKDLMQTGIVKPQNFYNAARKLVEAVGEKNPDKFFTAPDEQEGPDPEVEAQIKQLTDALEAATAEVERLEADQQAKQQELQVKQFDAETKRMSVEMSQPEPQAPDNSAFIAQETAIQVAQINAESAQKIKMMELASQEMAAQRQVETEGQSGQDPQSMMDMNNQMMQQIIEALTAPRTLIRDDQGRAVGSEVIRG